MKEIKNQNEKINDIKKEIDEKIANEQNLKLMFEKVLNENIELKNKVESFEFQDILNNDMKLKDKQSSKNIIINNTSNKSLTLGKNSQSGNIKNSGSNIENLKKESKNNI